MRYALLALLVLCCTTEAANAYIGPGLGMGVVTTVLGVLGSFALAVFAVVWYPLKRLYKKMRRRRQDAAP